MAYKDLVKTLNKVSIAAWAIVSVLMICAVICYGYQAYNMPVDLSKAQADITNGNLAKLLLLTLFGFGVFCGIHAIERYTIYKLSNTDKASS